MDFAAARQTMVDTQVRVNDVTDRVLQAAMGATPREAFCAPDRAFSAYAEVEVEIAGGRRLMMARDVAKLIQALDASPGERALAIAGPYAAAVLARMGLQVAAQEADAAVLDVVAQGLEVAGVDVVVAPLDQPHGGDWDIIISEGAVGERPEAWLQALKIGGRLAVVERSGAGGRAILYVRGPSGYSRRDLFDAAPPMLPAMERAPAFQL
jgi:protein-L-isoaspartate(D-aspartate) O-methyltransferase